jgi:hypothetical protein
MRKKLHCHLSYANVMATIATFIALGGTTYAATGGAFILGRSNAASSTTALSTGTTGAAFKVTNTSTGTGGSFNVAAGHQPITVNSGVKVTNLNADKLDGLDSSSLISTSTLRRFNFEATIPPLIGNGCADGTLSGLGLQGQHLVLTPERESALPDFEYSVLYKSASSSAVLRTCNVSKFDVDQFSHTRFNLVAIAP